MTLRDSFETYLQEQVSNSISGVTKDAMTYSLMIGGKRVRPQLVFDTLEGYGMDPKVGFPAACALEMIHTYSLIHDDLPAMDDDELRRGQPTCHIQFNEATAILAGDGLLTKAFEILCESECDPATLVEMISYTAQYAGVDGMIYGQELDIRAEQEESLPLEEIEMIDHYKTGKLLTLPFLYAACLANKKDDIDSWVQLGSLIGLQFQIQDDILDVIQSQEILGKSTSDEENQKSTYVSIMGLDKAKERVASIQDEILSTLESIQIEPTALKKTLDKLANREK